MEKSEIVALPKHIYNKAIELNVGKIILHWSGGSDVGYLNISLYGKDNSDPKNEDNKSTSDYRHICFERKAHLPLEAYTFSDEIESWAEDAYDYNGAGDGTDYGDDVTYDINKKTIVISSWCLERFYAEKVEMTEEDAEKNNP